jgi:hypothetical protein
MGLSAFAQNSVTVSEPRRTNPADKVIIKEYNTHYPVTITCSSYQDTETARTTFIYSSDSLQAHEISIDDYYVNDMVVGNDSVFFCGKQKSTGKGVIGYFRINNAFFGPGQIHVVSNFIAGENQYDILELTRLVHFYEDNGLLSHVACIGICDEWYKYPCLIDLTLGMIHTYMAGVVERNDEELCDIKMVRSGLMYDDYHLVTTGFDLQYGRYINIRVYKPSDIFSTSGLQDMCHVYSIDTGYVRPWLDGGVLLTDVGDYSFATVSYRSSLKEKPDKATYADTSNYYKKSRNIHLAYFQINPIINNSVYGMTENYEIPFSGASDCAMERVVNSPAVGTLAFLHAYEHNIPSVLECAYCEVKRSALTVTGYFQAYSNPGVKQAGLSLFHSNQNYILSGFEMSTPTNLEYQMNTFGVLSNCAEPKDYKYEQLNPVNSWNFKEEFSVIGGTEDPVTIIVSPEEFPLIIKCEK